VEAPKVSIIIVNYKTPDLLVRCVEQVFQSRNGVPLEVIVVDNCSDDDSAQRVSRRFNEVTVLRNEHNLGFARGVNRGIRESSGAYLLAMNPDTQLPPEGLGPLIRFAEEKFETENAGIFGCRLLNGDGSLQYSCGRFPTLRRTVLDAFRPRTKRKYLLKDYQKPAEADWVTGACILIRRDLLDSVGLLDENFFMYYEDVDLCFRARKKGWKVYYFPGTEVFHYYPHSQRKENYDYIPVEIRRSHLYFYKKNYSRLEYLALLGLTFGFAAAFLLNPLRIFSEARRRMQRSRVARQILKDIFLNGKTRGRVYSGDGQPVWPERLEEGVKVES
jgi:GT2 family glycosyltransferase